MAYFWRPSPEAPALSMSILTLTSDFGPQDYLTGAVKGMVLRADEAFRPVDITHSVTPFNYPHAAYVCRNAFPHFPAGSFHLVLVNLFDARLPHLLLARRGDAHIAIADNGLLGMILPEGPDEVVALAIDPARRGEVLHLVDVMLQGIQGVRRGQALGTLGDAGVEVRVKSPVRPQSGVDWMEGHIIHIDAFENVVLDITREAFEAQRRGRDFRIFVMRNESIDRISESYADVPEGEKLARFNAAGYLEIAMNKGNAAGLLGLQQVNAGTRRAEVRALQTTQFYRVVRIHFA